MHPCIQLLVDDFDLEDGEDIHLVNPDDIPHIRQKIYAHLAYGQGALSIRMSSVFFQRFKSFEGGQGITVKRISPFLQLSHQLGEAPPLWLTDALAEKLGLYQRGVLSDELKRLNNSTVKVLALLHSDLLAQDSWQAFCVALQQQTSDFINILKIDVVTAYLHTQLSTFMPIEIVAGFLKNLQGCNDIAEFLRALALEQYWEKLRKVLEQHCWVADIALPARQFSPDLIAQLPELPLQEHQAHDLVVCLCDLLDTVERRIRMDEQKAGVLADFVFVAWPQVLAHLAQLFQDNSDIGTTALRDVLQTMGGDEARKLAVRVNEHLQYAPCEVLPENAPVEQVLDWSERYFSYTLREFLHGREPQNSICQSFSRWVYAQQPRIMRSNADWRSIAPTIEQYLSEDYLVLVFMVDALGAIHADMLERILRERVNDLHIDSRTVFAPLPTLTEVGKAAVLTGQAASEVSSDYEKALRQRYATWLEQPESLKIVKSFRESSEHLDANTRLLVYFENRLDERLHGCLSFAKHREEVEPILKQLTRSLADWVKDAVHLGKKPIILITADHGATTIAQKEACHLTETIIKDRVLQTNEEQAHNLPDDFVFIPGRKPKGYAVPLKRIHFGDTPLTHGGLTPEEVFIPLFTLSREALQADEKIPIKVNVLKPRCPTLEKGWHLELSILPRIRLNKLQLQFNEPFDANTPNYSDLQAHSETKIPLQLVSEQAQSGLTQVDLTLRYLPDKQTTWTSLTVNLSLDLVAPLMQQTQEADNFNKMF
ncbi:PglZ domain-containing protein [Candidatus Venteria ishoeyi]|uniref:PglZ domain-containing protein n=1 Tax=Candidatus Venteria ishoeyi TaxID=1899563 RepID=UPI0025A54E5E|nr:PglZ domain-containing protein [Candidatus Venteria ishoeyi]MDM8545781.1 PglZ domain-containing protein [Candidatus Venteria ishoeyi]